VSSITTVYPPPLPGLPYLAVLILKNGECEVTAFDSADDAEAYVTVYDESILAEKRAEKGFLDC
jgi:hypothetical protein